MQETQTQTQSRRVSEYDRPQLNDPPRRDYDVPHWEPDWWSRMMAVGSMLVAAAALWHVRHPETTLADNSTSSSIVGTLGAGNDEPAEPSTVSEETETDAETDAPAAEKADAVEKTEVSAMEHALASADDDAKTATDEKTTKVLRANDANELLDEADEDEGGDKAIDALKAFVSPAAKPETEMVEVESSDEDEPEADKPPRIANKPLTLDGFSDVDEGLVTVNVEPRALATEYAVTLRVRNNSDELAVISRVVFEPNDIIEDVSTEFATRPFGVSSASEFALAFATSDNQAQDKSDQGRYVRVLQDTFNVPADSAVDLRIAIDNDEHVGWGLIGKLTLEYNTAESLDIENVSVAFIGEQEEE